MLRKVLLAPYYLILKIRHALYDKGLWKVHSCNVPTICIGNIAVGGTGKTPHTEMLLRTLLRSAEWNGRNLAVLSRGHKRNSEGFQQVEVDGTAAFYGDEPLQIKRKFPGVTVAVDRNRVEGCRFLCNPELIRTEKKGRKCKNKFLPQTDLIVLDDAFQHRSLKAHFNIILVDFYRPVSEDCLLPFGHLRDLPQRLKYADVFIVTKCPVYLEDEEKCRWIKTLGINDFDIKSCTGTDKYGKTVHVFFTSINYCPPTPVYPEEGDNRYAYSKKLILFSGIAKDTPLRRYLSDSYDIVKRFSFMDHHKYSGVDIKRILMATRSFPTAVVATTEKDSQRVRDYKKVPESLKNRMFQVPIEVAFLSDNEQKVFEETLLEALRRYSSES